MYIFQNRRRSNRGKMWVGTTVLEHAACVKAKKREPARVPACYAEKRSRSSAIRDIGEQAHCCTPLCPATPRRTSSRRPVRIGDLLNCPASSEAESAPS